MVGGAKWLDTDRWEITAKLPEDPKTGAPIVTAPEANAKDPLKANAMLSRLVSCHNLTMDQFAVLIETFSWGYFADPIVNATNLKGTWDATLNFSPWSVLEGKGVPGTFVNGVRQGFGLRPAGDAGADAAVPSGALSIFDAFEKQVGLKPEPMKSTVQVMVVDHIEQTPTEN